MFGYDPEFLGKDVLVPLPGFRQRVAPSIYCTGDADDVNFQNKYYTRYMHFSIATNKERRQPAIVALNIDQALIIQVPRREWNMDPQIGKYQLGEDYFRENVYDRGHLARRASVAWGETEDEALAASNSSMFYSNASLQHENFNQDEWLELEDWVKDTQEAASKKVSVFTGPIYTRRDGTSKVIGNPPAQIPSAYFKIICFIDMDGKLATRAFMMAQDAKALSDKNGRNRNFDLGAYQVSVDLIEDETGYVFPSILKEADPFGNEQRDLSSLKEEQYEPIIAPIIRGKISSTSTPQLESRPIHGVGIISAMVDAKGAESRNEWIGIANLTDRNVDLNGWSLSDTIHKPQKLTGFVHAGEIRRYDRLYNARSSSGVVLSNKRATIVLLDKEGRVVDRVSYSCRNRRITEGVPLTFHVDDRFSSEET